MQVKVRNFVYHLSCNSSLGGRRCPTFCDITANLRFFYDGKQFPIEPGQTVIPHGPDCELTVDEALPRKIKPDIYQAT